MSGIGSEGSAGRNDRALAILEELSTILRSPHSTEILAPDTVTPSRHNNMPMPDREPTRAWSSSFSQFRQVLPLGTTFSRSNGEAAVVAEVNRSFQPYPSTSRVAARRSERPFRGRILEARPREWIHALFCLSGPDDCRTPSHAKKMLLESNGLGAKILRIDAHSNLAALTTAIRRLFPKLENVEFELLKAVGGGAGRQLTRITLEAPIPALIELQGMMSRSVIYVRPLMTVLGNDESQTELNATAFLSVGIEDRYDAGMIEEVDLFHTDTDETSGNVILTMDDLRRQIYSDNAGIQPIFVQRDDFAMQVIGTYKTREFQILKKPQFMFAGESGADVGALQKEFFWRGIQSLTNERYDGRLPFFEGENNHKLPTCDASLLRSGVFKVVGMFMAHGAIHSGLAFVGLSKAVVEYLTMADITADTPLTISVEDLPDEHQRQVVKALEEWTSGIPPSTDTMTSIKEFAEVVGFNEKVDHNTRMYFREHILYHVVIEKRQPQLEAIKQAFRDTPLLKFLQGRDFVIPGLFPSVEDVLNEPSLVIRRIECDGDQTYCEYVKDFISTECSEPRKLQDLIAAWSGWAILPEDALKIKVVQDGRFCFHSCFQELEIPVGFSKEDVIRNLRMVLTYGSAGFGTI